MVLGLLGGEMGTTSRRAFTLPPAAGDLSCSGVLRAGRGAARPGRGGGPPRGGANPDLLRHRRLPRPAPAGGHSVDPGAVLRDLSRATTSGAVGAGLSGWSHRRPTRSAADGPGMARRLERPPACLQRPCPVHRFAGPTRTPARCRSRRTWGDTPVGPGRARAHLLRPDCNARLRRACCGRGAGAGDRINLNAGHSQRC